MKRLLLFTFLISSLFIGCTGEDGVPGRDGFDGYSAESAVWETPIINFNDSNNYGYVFEFPKPILDFDKVLVYRLTRQIQNNTDVWKLLPETFFFTEGPNAGTLSHKYDYDFTKFDVNIVLDGFDRINLNPNIRNNQIFRIVSIPGYQVSNRSKSSVDLNNYNEVMKNYNIDESKIVKLK
jgi:hypothetical protein